MATSGTYFINGPTLATATAVFNDAAMTSCAPDGFYSDGTIVREQVSCALSTVQTCPACRQICGDAIVSLNATPGIGLFYVDINTEYNLGAIVIRFNPIQIPLGIIAELGALQYNGFSTNLYGWIQGTAGLPSVIGETASDCGIVAGSPHTLDEYDYVNGTFVALGTDVNESFVVGQIVTTLAAPTICVMVIPKLDNSYTILKNKIYSMCGSPGEFEIQVDCPVLLPTWDGGKIEANGIDACLSPANKTYHYVHVNGAGGVLGLYDMVFSDAYGQNPLPAGFYNTGSMSATWSWVEVDANGVVIGFGTCPVDNFYTVEKCYTPAEVYVIGVPGTLLVGDFVSLVEFPGCVFEVTAATVGPATATYDGFAAGNCTSQCSQLLVTNTGGVDIEMKYTDCSGAAVAGIFITPGDSVRICALEYDAVIPPNLAVDFELCECLYEHVYLIELCGDPLVTFVASYLSSIPVTDMVQISDPAYAGCWFNIVGISAFPATTNIVSTNAGAFECADRCVRYNVSNPGPGASTFSYVNCDDTPMTVSILVGSDIEVCARPNTVSSPDVFVAISLLSCNC